MEQLSFSRSWYKRRAFNALLRMYSYRFVLCSLLVMGLINGAQLTLCFIAYLSQSATSVPVRALKTLAKKRDQLKIELQAEIKNNAPYKNKIEQSLGTIAFSHLNSFFAAIPSFICVTEIRIAPTHIVMTGKAVDLHALQILQTTLVKNPIITSLYINSVHYDPHNVVTWTITGKL